MNAPLSLKEQAYIAIRDAILNKTIRLDRVYSEKWFADSLAISRTPVREALLQLRAEGLLDVIPNRGFRVHLMTAEDAKYIFEMRAAIESFCAGELARRCEELDAIRVLDSIGLALNRCETHFNKSDELYIHHATIQFVNNPLFLAQFANIRSRVDIFWRDVIDQEQRREEVMQEHRDIYNAMRSGDEIGAITASKIHSRITLERLQKGDGLHVGLSDIKSFPPCEEEPASFRGLLKKE